MITAIANHQAFEQYEALLILLAQAMKAADKERASQIRREMELPERELDDAMLDRLDGLSADLYMLDGKEHFERIVPEQVTPQHLVSDLKRAWEGQNWEEVLRLLRKDVPVISQEHRAYLRAISYENLELVRAALAFMDYAAAQNPEDVAYPYLSLEYLNQLGEDAEAFRRASAYVNDEKIPPVLRIRAAVTLTQTAQRLEATEASERLETAALVLARTLSSKEGWEDIPREAIALAYVSLGICLEALGNSTKAAHAYRLAREVHPEGTPSQKELDHYLGGRSRTSRAADIQVPDEAAKSRPAKLPFQILKARQILPVAA